ncbi:hypothetical protein F2P79_008381 [Pimephales promelas]|nr:hypothetical protein F2P79_008381 [Pimephales promelas]
MTVVDSGHSLSFLLLAPLACLKCMLRLLISPYSLDIRAHFHFFGFSLSHSRRGPTGAGSLVVVVVLLPRLPCSTFEVFGCVS